ncbi:hypothetical protein EON65_04795 [archaeon]|nr:MAG: hypothetical protein EON65_04795 [archaeon]
MMAASGANTDNAYNPNRIPPSVFVAHKLQSSNPAGYLIAAHIFIDNLIDLLINDKNDDFITVSDVVDAAIISSGRVMNAENLQYINSTEQGDT